MAFFITTEIPAFVYAALFLKLAYSSGSATGEGAVSEESQCESEILTLVKCTVEPRRTVQYHLRSPEFGKA